MSDTHINEKLDDYMDGSLDEAETLALDAHVYSCNTCRQMVESEQRFRGLLKDYPVPAPDDAYFDQALAKASHVSTNGQRNRWLMTGFGGAVAAGLLAWVIGGTILQTPEPVESVANIPGVTMVLEEPRTVNLVLSSARYLVY